MAINFQKNSLKIRKYGYYKIVFIFLLLTVQLYGKNIDLDTILSNENIFRNEKNLYEIDKNIEKAKYNFHSLGDYNGVNLILQYNKYIDSNDVGSGSKYLKSSFGPFYFRADSSMDVINNDKINFAVGVEKNIKDLIYSKNISEISKIDYNISLLDIGHTENIDTKKVKIINMYRDIKNKQFEISLNTKALNELIKKHSQLKKMYELGNISKIDLDSIDYEVEKIKINLEVLRSDEKNLLDTMNLIFNIDLYGMELLDITEKRIDLKEFLNNYGLSNIKNTELEIKLLEEEYNYSNYNDIMPDIILGYERKYNRNKDVRDNIFKVNFSKDFLNYDLTSKVTKENINKKNIELSEKKKTVESTKLEYVNNYKNLSKKYELALKKLDLESKRYNIKEKEYQLGKINYSDYMESFQKKLEVQIDVASSKNILNAYIYELIIRSK